MRIEKSGAEGRDAPNLTDYDQARRTFGWDAERRELDGLPGGQGLNLAYEAVGRHVAGGHGAQTAIVWLSAFRPGATDGSRALSLRYYIGPSEPRSGITAGNTGSVSS